MAAASVNCRCWKAPLPRCFISSAVEKSIARRAFGSSGARPSARATSDSSVACTGSFGSSLPVPVAPGGGKGFLGWGCPMACSTIARTAASAIAPAPLPPTQPH